MLVSVVPLPPLSINKTTEFLWCSSCCLASSLVHDAGESELQIGANLRAIWTAERHISAILELSSSCQQVSGYLTVVATAL